MSSPPTPSACRSPSSSRNPESTISNLIIQESRIQDLESRSLLIVVSFSIWNLESSTLGGSSRGDTRARSESWRTSNAPNTPQTRWKHAGNTLETRSKHAPKPPQIGKNGANAREWRLSTLKLQTRPKHAGNTLQTRSKHAPNTLQTRSKTPPNRKKWS